MAVITRDGVDIYYDYSDAQGEGEAVLLTHGFSATSGMWSGQVDNWRDSHKVITWDMRGHGQSDSPDDAALYSEEHTIDDMAAILDACDVREAVIGGLSLGGYMSLAFNLKYGARVRALMLFDTGPGYKNDVAREGWNRNAVKVGDMFEERGLDALGKGAEVRVSQHRSAQGLAHAARGMLAQVDDRIIQSLPDIEVPALVLVGEQDEPFRGATDYMAIKIPNATRAIIADAGHAANINQPDRFNEAVLGFLGALEA